MFDDEHTRAKGYDAMAMQESVIIAEHKRRVREGLRFLIRKGIVRSVFVDGEVKYEMIEEHKKKSHNCSEQGCYSEQEIDDFESKDEPFDYDAWLRS